MGKVIYLTGAPATGKSTLCANLVNQGFPITVFSYSQLLRDHVNQRNNSSFDEIDVRKHSAGIITREDVDQVDSFLIAEVDRLRGTNNVLIDSHAVTKEAYGFRVTSFSASQLNRLKPDAIICLYATSEVIASRIRDNAAGRPLPSDFELSMHVHLQSGLATQYAFTQECSLYLMNSEVEPEELANRVHVLAKLER